MAVNRTADEVYEGDPEPLFADQGLKLRVLDRDAHPQQRLPAAPGGPQRADREGFGADLVVLDRDLLRVPLKKVSKAKVELTVVGGEIVHRA